MLADYQFSDDSTYPLEQVVKDAITLGLDEICITDHVDYGVKADWDSGIPLTSSSCLSIRRRTRNSGPRIFRQDEHNRNIMSGTMANCCGPFGHTKITAYSATWI